ncbi:MAG: hypothetical protein JWO91_2867 [Acidobacteriaceae bacterium]|nr:hypothetical protein [Acidobacteriaceae bacterium]
MLKSTLTREGALLLINNERLLCLNGLWRIESEYDIFLSCQFVQAVSRSTIWPDFNLAVRWALERKHGIRSGIVNVQVTLFESHRRPTEGQWRLKGKLLAIQKITQQHRKEESYS